MPTTVYGDLVKQISFQFRAFQVPFYSFYKLITFHRIDTPAQNPLYLEDNYLSFKIIIIIIFNTFFIVNIGLLVETLQLIQYKYC